jgi:hypothetical protein
VELGPRLYQAEAIGGIAVREASGSSSSSSGARSIGMAHNRPVIAPRSTERKTNAPGSSSSSVMSIRYNILVRVETDRRGQWSVLPAVLAVAKSQVALTKRMSAGAAPCHSVNYRNRRWNLSSLPG